MTITAIATDPTDPTDPTDRIVHTLVFASSVPHVWISYVIIRTNQLMTVRTWVSDQLLDHLNLREPRDDAARLVGNTAATIVAELHDAEADHQLFAGEPHTLYARMNEVMVRMLCEPTERGVRVTLTQEDGGAAPWENHCDRDAARRRHRGRFRLVAGL